METTNHLNLKQFLGGIDKRKLFLWIPFFIWVGIVVILEDIVSIKLFIIVLLILIALFCRFNIIRNKILFPLLFGGLSAFFTLRNLENFHQLEKEIPFTNVSGVIERVEYITNGVRLIVNSEKYHKLSVRCILKNCDNKIWVPGNRIKFYAKLYPFTDDLITYNFKKSARFEEIYANAVVLSKPEIIGRGGNKFITFIAQIRNLINIHINNCFIDQTKGIAKALVTGDKGDIPNIVKIRYANAGISHILAISGLHISLIFGFVFFFIRYLITILSVIFVQLNSKKIAAVVALFVAFFYVLIADLRIPASRALLMQFLVTLAIIFDRDVFSLKSVSIAAIVILLLIPQSVYSAGFYMSFFAVFGLISYYEFRSQNNYFIDIMKSSIISSVVIIPFSLFFFNQLVINGILTNLIVIPVTGFIVMPSLFMFVLGVDFMSFFSEFGILLINKIAELNSYLDIFSLHLVAPSFLVMLLFVIGLFFAFMDRFNLLSKYSLFFIFSAIIIYIFEPNNFLFVNDNYGLIGITDSKSLYVNDLRKKRSITNSWLQYSGLKEKKKFLIMKHEDGDIYVSKNYKISKSNNTIKINDKIATKKTDVYNTTNIYELSSRF